jgi:hypothetical protein
VLMTAKVLPQPQVALISEYSGCILLFIINLKFG